MKVEYFKKDLGQTFTDATPTDFKIKDTSDLEYDISLFCEYLWNNHDGWEWLRDGEILSIVVDGAYIGDFEIRVDFDPTFFATQRGLNILTGR